jgi:hypothetical protein
LQNFSDGIAAVQDWFASHRSQSLPKKKMRKKILVVDGDVELKLMQALS